MDGISSPDRPNDALVDPNESPVDPDESQYLLRELAGLSWRSQLFTLEAINLASARSWLDVQQITRDELLTQSFQQELHWRMFGAVWMWAGKLRVRENNIGIAPKLIIDRWAQLLGNVAYWLDNGIFDADEACVRYYFEQREIQPFHDGNSRMARVVVNELADLAGLSVRGGERYPFGQGGDSVAVRAEYLSAIVAARLGDLDPLVALARRGVR